jgi:hypothetical protein
MNSESKAFKAFYNVFFRNVKVVELSPKRQYVINMDEVEDNFQSLIT